MGLGTLLGLWTRLAALGGLVLALTLFLTVSFHSSPYYTGADIVFVFAWIPLILAGSGGVLSLDGLIAARAHQEQASDDPTTVADPFRVVQAVCGHYKKGRCSVRPTAPCQPCGLPFLEDEVAEHRRAGWPGGPTSGPPGPGSGRRRRGGRRHGRPGRRRGGRRGGPGIGRAPAPTGGTGQAGHRLHGAFTTAPTTTTTAGAAPPAARPPRSPDHRTGASRPGRPSGRLGRAGRGGGQLHRPDQWGPLDRAPDEGKDEFVAYRRRLPPCRVHGRLLVKAAKLSSAPATARSSTSQPAAS